MQKPGRPSANGVGGPYSDQQILDALLGQVAAEEWYFDLLDAYGHFIQDLSPYVNKSSAPTLTHNTTQDVKRTLSLEVSGKAPLEPLQQLIRVRYRLTMRDGGEAEFHLGVFTMLPGQGAITPSVTWNSVTLADYGLLLVDSGLSYAYSVGAGSGYILAIHNVVETYGGRTPIEIAIPDPGIRIPASLAWDAGSTRLKVVNDLLAAINYLPAWFDEEGVLRSSPIPDYSQVEESFTFDAVSGTQAIRADQAISRDPDPSNWYNQFIVTVQDARRTNGQGPAYQGAIVSSQNNTSTGAPPYQGAIVQSSDPNAPYGQQQTATPAIVERYVNTDPASPISVDNWRPRLKVWQDSTIADRDTARAVVRTAAQAAAMVYDAVTMSTFAWPLSQSYDVFRFIYETEDEPLSNHRYLETQWSMNCVPGGATAHQFERLADNV